MVCDLAMPALLTSTEGGPRLVRMRSAVEAMAVGSVMSQAKKWTFSSVQISAQKFITIWAERLDVRPCSSSGNCTTSRTATLTPCFASPLTTNAPMPPHPPVTTAISLLSSHLFFSLLQRPAFSATLLSCWFAVPNRPSTTSAFSALRIRGRCCGLRRAAT